MNSYDKTNLLNELLNKLFINKIFIKQINDKYQYY